MSFPGSRDHECEGSSKTLLAQNQEFSEDMSNKPERGEEKLHMGPGKSQAGSVKPNGCSAAEDPRAPVLEFTVPR